MAPQGKKENPNATELAVLLRLSAACAGDAHRYLSCWEMMTAAAYGSGFWMFHWLFTVLVIVEFEPADCEVT